MDSAKGKYGYVVATFTTSQTEYEDVIIWSDKYIYSPYTIDEIYVDGVKRDVVQKQRMYGRGDHEVVYFPKPGMDIIYKYVFSGCSRITKIDLTNYKQYSIIDATGMFSDMPLLKEIIGLDNIYEIGDMNECFMGCSSIQTIDLSSWYAPGCRLMNCYSLKNVKLPGGTQYLSNISGLFENCQVLESIDLTVLYTRLVKGLNNLASGCTALKQLNLNTDLSSVNTIAYMCNGCLNLTKIDLQRLRTNDINEGSSAFYGSGIVELDMLDIKIPVYARNMFANMKSLKLLKMAGDPSFTSDIQGMFDSTATGGTFYYNDAYDYSKIISKLPYNWKSQAI